MPFGVDIKYRRFQFNANVRVGAKAAGQQRENVYRAKHELLHLRLAARGEQAVPDFLDGGGDNAGGIGIAP